MVAGTDPCDRRVGRGTSASPIGVGGDAGIRLGSDDASVPAAAYTECLTAFLSPAATSASSPHQSSPWRAQ